MDENLFRGQYRIPSARLKNWDYRSTAPYFITICTHKMQHIFGKIENGQMILNELGIYARQCIDNLEIHFIDDEMESAQSSQSPGKSNISIINQTIMPNHLHILLELKNHTCEHLPNRFGPLLKKSLSSILNHYKGRITKFGKGMQIPKVWHPRFHDHVVRDMIEYQRIFDYITNNPANWKDDKFRNSK